MPFDVDYTTNSDRAPLDLSRPLFSKCLPLLQLLTWLASAPHLAFPHHLGPFKAPLARDGLDCYHSQHFV